MKRRDFIYNCMLCASAIPFSGCIQHTKNFQINNNRKKYLKYIEIPLVEHCNLNCKYCAHFSCIADKEYYDVKNYEKDIEKLAIITNSHINGIALMGGEPLLHPEIEHIFDITRFYFPQSYISLVTNAILINNKSKSFWQSMNKNNITFIPSIYPIELNWKSILSKAKKYNILVKDRYNYEDITLENIESNTIRYFRKYYMDIQGQQDINYHCDLRGVCINYYKGKLFSCFIIANIRHFNKKFNKNIPITKKDYIDVYKAKNINELISFVNTPAPFCKYCSYNNRSRKKNVDNRKWEYSSEHSIDEWAI